MPRQADKGLGYTSLDVTFFQDRKIRKLQRHCGPSSALVYIALLCTIFKEGYYTIWDDDLVYDLADSTRLEDNYISETLNACLEFGLFSKEMKERYGILTSVGIQRQYQLICEKSKRKSRVKEYSLLVSSEETQQKTQSDGISSEEMPISSEDIPINSEDMQQRKVKKSKEKESKDYSYSSCGQTQSRLPTEAEEEKEKYLSFMFFEDWASPNKELEKFIAFNNTGGRRWDRMSKVERQSALVLWKQQPEQPKHLGGFLGTWREVYNGLLSLNAPYEIRMDALADKLKWDVENNRVLLYCSAYLSEYLERNLSTFEPVIQKFLCSRRYAGLRYITIPRCLP